MKRLCRADLPFSARSLPGLRYLVALSFLVLCSIALPEERVWTNSDGKKIHGVFVDQNGETVTLLVKGRKFEVPRSSLSKPDQEFLEELAAKPGESGADKTEISRISEVVVTQHEGPFTITNEKGELVSEPLVTPPTDYDGSELPVRYSVETGEILNVPGGTELQILTSNGATGKVAGPASLKVPSENKTSSLNLLKGKLFLNVDSEKLKESNTEFRVKTPPAILAVRGTRFFVSTEESNTDVGLLEGAVSAIRDGAPESEIPPGSLWSLSDGKESASQLSDELEEELKDNTESLVERIPLTDRVWDWEWNWEAHRTGGTELTGVSESKEKGGAFEAVLELKEGDDLYFSEKKYSSETFVVSMAFQAPAELQKRIIGAEISVHIDGAKGGLFGRTTDASFLSQGRARRSQSSLNSLRLAENIRMKAEIIPEKSDDSFDEIMLRPLPQDLSKPTRLFVPLPQQSLQSGGINGIILQKATSWEIIFLFDKKNLVDGSPLRFFATPPTILLTAEESGK